eukprot:40530-Eustigmatos_ZCMA.PRE.1
MPCDGRLLQGEMLMMICAGVDADRTHRAHGCARLAEKPLSPVSCTMQTVLKRHQRHLTPSSLSKALKDLRLRYGYLDEDLPAVILR